MTISSQDVVKDIQSGHIAVIGSRTDDPGRLPIAGSTPSPCVKCSRDVMISPATRQGMTGLSVVLCTDCAVVVAEARGEPWIHPGRSDDQLREMADNGHTPERWYGQDPKEGKDE